ncbi:MAG: hypothetical protein ISS74_07035 [Planctomycetes bacterium]|nr:hypothetical protein [Planctomycetota bacterium]
MFYVTLHAAWMILAVAIGTVAGYMGLLRATMGKGGRSPLPGRFKMRPHVAFGTAYYLMLYAGMLFGWLMSEYLLPGPYLPSAIGNLHIGLAIAIGVLYGLAWVIGGGLTKKPAGASRLRPRLHMVCNYTACTLVAVQIGVAVYYVWIL